MKRNLKIIIGSILLFLGGIGIFLPVLPTTPFVIGAASMFCSAHPKTYDRLQKSPFFGEYIACYREQRGVTIRTKVISIVFLWALLILSIVLRYSVLLLGVLSIIGILVTFHIALLPGQVRRNDDDRPVP